MPVSVQGPDGNTYQFPDGTDKTAAVGYFKKKGIGVPAAPKAGILDRVASGVANALPAITPEQARSDPRFQRYDTFKAHPELARDITNLGTQTAVKLAGIPASIADWVKAGFSRESWVPGAAISQHAADAQAGGAQPFDPKRPVTGSDVGDFASDTGSSLAAGAIAGEVTGGLIHGGRKLISGGAEEVAATPPTSGTLRRGAQKMLDLGPGSLKQAVGDRIEDAGKKAETVRGQNKAATETTLAKRGAVDEANAKADRDLAERNAVKQADVHKQNIAQLRKEAQERLETLKKNRENTKDYTKKVAETKLKNQAILDAAKDRHRIETDLTSASRDLDQKIETAQKTAKANDDAAWNDWRKKVGGTEIPSDPIVAAIHQTRAGMDPEDVSEFRKVLAESEPTDEDMSASEKERHDISRGQYKKDYEDLSPHERETVDRVLNSEGIDPDEMEAAGPKSVSAARLHVWKTQLEYAVRKATRGNVRYGIGKVLDSVRAAEAELSEAAGATPELEKARALHGPYVDTFRNSPNEPATVASKSLAETAPEHVKAQAAQERLDMLGRYDASIPSLARHVENLRGASKAIPGEKPFAQLPERPTTEPKPKPGEQKEFTPKTRVAKPYEEPEPNKPVKVPEVNTREVRQEMITKLSNRFKISGYDGGILASSLFAHPLIALLGQTGEAMRVGALGYVGGKAIVRSALESPRMVEWLSRPNPGEIEALRKLPNADRIVLVDGMTEAAVDEAKAGKPVKLSPEAARLIGPKNAALVTAAVMASHPRNPAEAKKQLQDLRGTK